MPRQCSSSPVASPAAPSPRLSWRTRSPRAPSFQRRSRRASRDSDLLPIYTLTKDRQHSVCHEFSGTMTYTDGYRVDCATGNVWYTPPPQT
jgi:hypothetical protein